ncbi:hypothetical protein TGPRC2_200360 [Toxoplasma gondii TgCatPRC2]|uniref:Transmembrane protein n=12 Tax=Toxoplasma gondii TaxID=5811 RepID=B9Q3N8_TOXGV|nr:hypothetical protein TGGT1_200360 [Toxoplasma gondii GT1]ESS36462.1 hypothetical protein TGVEG_200360 [Toxoplasma gondii VEG]KAF4642509.1 hypothetical protein TGRH88_083200 [Toxoplasma gondii]KFG27937.1 hypothetical protein TGP89_200360 [Toxoplasma gondii p89]KFG29607.1 hypothetical protein TGDOM2_200360 [Toxoplasma gondii GAB2-2007-GAL-DOM2]KFG32679.1 hypothetical protein TGFOU_200360 [Toxoplasma gondii FOU]KFG56763.1 hypothetical protein TGRUB_200360 [Toxoplasma gondii RUB]KFG99412.1 hy
MMLIALVCMLVHRLDLGAAVSQDGRDLFVGLPKGAPLGSTFIGLTTPRPPLSSLSALQTFGADQRLGRPGDSPGYYVEAKQFYRVPPTRSSATRNKGTSALKVAAALALLAVLGTEVADYVDRQHEGEVTDLEYDQRMQTTRTALGVTRLASLVLATFGSVRFMLDKASKWMKARKVEDSEKSERR